MDFNGFDKFAKLVEFDEKIFDNKTEELGYKVKDLKTA